MLRQENHKFKANLGQQQQQPTKALTTSVLASHFLATLFLPSTVKIENEPFPETL